MTSTTIDITDAVANQLKASDWGVDLVTKRVFVSEHTLEELDTPRMTLVPGPTRTRPGTRESTEREVDVDVILQQRLPQDAGEYDATVVKLIGVLEAVEKSFYLQPLLTIGNAECIESEFEPVYAAEHLEQYRTYSGRLRLTFLTR